MREPQFLRSQSTLGSMKLPRLPTAYSSCCCNISFE